MEHEQLAALVADLRATARAVRSENDYLAEEKAKAHEVLADAIEHPVAERDAALAEVARLSLALAAETAKREAMERALDRLARLGNEPHYGNSKGNEIARATLAEHGSKT